MAARPARPSAERASTRERTYAQAALEGCAEELADTAAGDRNNILYKKAFRIGTMVAAGWIARAEVEAALFEAATACGLVNDDGEVQTRRTIESGLETPAAKAASGFARPGRAAGDRAGQQEPPPQLQPGRRACGFQKMAGRRIRYRRDQTPRLRPPPPNALPGDPLWLLVISGPGSAKTETVQALAGAGAHVTSTIAVGRRLAVRLAAQERNKKATGGLLRKIGDRGILVIKDVTSILSPTATRAPACSPPSAKSMTADGSAMSAPMAARP